MWVSRSELERLEKRISELEQKAKYAYDGNITVNKELPEGTFYVNPYTYYWPSAKISVETVLHRILDKLGMKLTYVVGSPERVEIKESNAAVERSKE